MPLSFRLLGPLEAWQDGREIPLGTGRQRALLALLLVHANDVVSADRLIEELWAGNPPASAPKVVQGYVSQLRRALPADTIATRGSGYLLTTGETDAQEFMRLVDEASALAPTDAAPALRRALALWRGPPLSEFEYDDWAQAEIAHVKEQRLVALEELADADLQLGRHAQVVADLEALLADHPLRERLRGLLMVALYRSGRQADALEAYAQGRRKLDELGLEPSPSLEALQKAILTHDDSLAAPPVRSALPPALVRRGRILLVIGGLLLAGAIAAGAWELVGGPGSAAVTGSGNAVVGIDPASGNIVARIPVGKTPTSIVAGERYVWAISADDEAVTRIDPTRRRIVSVTRIGAAPIDLAVGGGALWLVNGRVGGTSGLVASAYPVSVSRLDRDSSVVTRTISLPFAKEHLTFSRAPGTSALAVGRNAVWAIGSDQSVLRIDPGSGRLLATVKGVGALSIAASDRAVWVDNDASTLIRIDTTDNRVAQRIPLGASGLNGIALGAGAIWVADPQDGTVWRVDPGPPQPVTRTIAVGIGVTAVSFGAGAVWASNSFLGTVSRIDPATNAVTRTIDVAGTPQNVSADDGGVWVSVTGTPAPGPAESGVEALPAATCNPVVAGGGSVSYLIASDLPLRGGAASATLPMTRAIQLVLQRHHFHAGKYAIGYQSCDDSTAQVGNFDFGTCGANAKAYARDKDVLGVIGPFNSPCALAEIPIMNRAAGGPAALISPLTTYPGLTHPGPGDHALLSLLYPTGRRNFARIIAPDDFQGAAHALLAKQLGLRRVYVIDDGQYYAADLRAGFDSAARRIGLRVIGTARWGGDTHSDTSLAVRIAQRRADGVVIEGFGGPAGWQLVRALRARLGKGAVLIAGDGFLTIPDLVQHVGAAANGMYVSFAGAPNEKLPAAGGAFVRAFSTTQANRNVASYAAAYGAQAAEVLLAAIARSDGTRSSVIRELYALHIRNGILGNFRFTSEGDMTPSPVTIFRVVGGTKVSSTFLEDFRGSVIDRVVNVPVSLAR